MILAVAALLAAAAAAQPSAQPAPKISEAAIEWLRIYPLTPYREYWTGTLDVDSLQKALPLVLTVLEKAGGQPTVPLANTASSPSAGTQQLSFRMTKKKAEEALKALRRIGSLAPPLIRPAGELVPLPEIKRKIAELSRDKQAHAAELAAMPAVSALVEAVLGHLVTAENVAQKLEAEVILNLTLQQRDRR